ncbi:hypothetical protein [Sporocytophaga myxococcoides]|uniref:hypothetical protein n=1 Tax=Sporocytophaga myxococcoides TaxID=153721 RepID=UPI00042145A7|nr:hypothetical protein [Sporocytophaga myxococcoides]
MTRKLFSFTFGALLICINAFCQAPILKDSTKVGGIYLSFSEFKNNKPSIKCQVRAKETKTVYGFFEKYVQYKMRLEDTIDIKMKQVWGFCDGKDVYRAEGLSFAKYDHIFNKMELLGKYSYYNTVSTSYMSAPAPSGGGSTVNQLVPFLLNMNNGFDYELNKEAIEEIIKRDEQLFSEYKADKQRKKRYYDYIKKYCETHHGI